MRIPAKPGTIDLVVKNYTSKFLKAVALLYMAFPAVYLTFAALLFDIPIKLCVRILLAPSYYVLSLLGILSGYGLWEMRRWGWYVFLATNLLIAYSSAVLVTDFGTTQHKFIAYLVCLAVVGGIVYRIGREVKVPYFLPRIRWWESNPRYKLVAPVQLKREDEELLEGEILDLSNSGCFIKLKQELKQGEVVTLRFTLYQESVECQGTVVWRAASTVTHPRGIGVKFAPLPRYQRRKLRAMNARLKKISAFYHSSRYLMTQDEFIKRLDELQAAKLKIYRPRRIFRLKKS